MPLCRSSSKDIHGSAASERNTFLELSIDTFEAESRRLRHVVVHWGQEGTT